MWSSKGYFSIVRLDIIVVEYVKRSENMRKSISFFFRLQEYIDQEHTRVADVCFKTDANYEAANKP